MGKETRKPDGQFNGGRHMLAVVCWPVRSGAASIVLKKNGEIVLRGTKITVQASGELALKGAKIREN